MRLPRIFVDASLIDGKRAILIGSEVRHVRRVLRLGPGDRLIGTDGTGKDYLLAIASAGPDAVVCDVLEELIPRSSETQCPIVLTQCCLSSGKMEQVVDRATQLGAWCIAPVLSEKSKFRGDQRRFDAKLARWRRIAISSSVQCGRASIPVIRPIAPLMEALKSISVEAVKLVFTTGMEGKSAQVVLPRFLSDLQAGREVHLLLGPEAGLSDAELKAAKAHGFEPVRAGTRIFRAEVAPIVALTLVLYHLDEL